MGSQAANTAENPVKVFWQDRPVKYTIHRAEREYTVEELRTPWDLYVEGSIFSSEVGDVLHQVMVANRMERIFSIRNIEGHPLCDILTAPEGKPLLDFSYGARRVFLTSSPMTVDGEKLVVMDVISRRGNRAADPVVSLAKDFYLAMGGQLRGEHPNGLVFQNKQDVKQWRKIVDADIKLDLMISAEPIKGQGIKANTWHAPTLAMAKSLLDARYWAKLHLNGDEDWACEVLSYIERDAETMPDRIIVYGGDKARELMPRVYKLMQGGTS